MSRFSKFVFIFLTFTPLFSGVGFVFAQTGLSAPKESKFIPQCALNNPTGKPVDEGECRSVSIFIILLLQFASYLFTIVGALALLFFIYGGVFPFFFLGAPSLVKKKKNIFF